MIIIKKKNVLHELAVSLFLMLEFDRDTAPLSLINRIRERATDALDAASVYTGRLGQKDVKAFLEARHLQFNISCGTDIVNGDVIRFVEVAFNNTVKPARRLGARGVIAEVTDIREINGNPILHMRVISSGGTWQLKPESTIRRTLRNVTRMEIMRVAWDSEVKREERKNWQHARSKTTKNAAVETLKRLSD